METKIDVKEMLAVNHEIFESVAVESLEALFQRPFAIKEPWTVTERLQGTFDYVISLGSGNDDYQSMIAIGLSKSTLAAIVEIDESLDLLDIFGEVGNTYCGLLMDHKIITDYCGFLNQSVPQYANEAIYFPKVWASSGNVYADEHPVYMGCAIRPVSSFFKQVQ